MKREVWQKLSEQVKKYRYVLAVIGLGIVLMLLPSGKKEEAPPPQTESFDLAAVQKEMENILSAIEGTGKLRLMLTVEATPERELAEDRTLNRDGTKEAPEHYENVQKTLTVNAGSSTQEVVVTRSVFPAFVGALVVCEGGESAAVRLRVTEALRVLTGLSADRISVVRGKP